MMARWTRSRICGETLASSLITRETVLIPTPARAATSRMVARARRVAAVGGADIDVSLPALSVTVSEFVKSQGG